ncbi:SidA/IucD/PvdA family monooxygenase, partial [Mesorhizobium amorphae]
MQRRKTLLVGSGPANLALLTCLKERGSSVLDSLEVLERRDSAEWHPGIAFEDSMLQVSLFKDLAFLRNPASPFTFFSFLRDKELLYHFIHTNNLYPSRKLFSDYLVWVSRFFANKISFGKEAVAARFHEKPSGTQTLVVTTRDVSSGDVSEI